MAKQERQVKNDLPKERITIFNDSSGKSVAHHYQGGNLLFGLVLIGGGTLLLLSTLDIIPWTAWQHVLQLWPLLIIFWGMQVIFSRNQFSIWLVNIIGAILIAFIILFVLHRTNPSLVSGLPTGLKEVFSIIGG